MPMRRTLKLLSFIFLAFFFTSCDSKEKPEEKEKPEVSYEVKFFGKLKDMMHKGDISAKAELKDLERNHLYALGAFENLKGEIQIFNGVSFSSYVEDSVLKFDKTFDKKATLLVSAHVSSWKEVRIPESVNSYEKLEKFIAKSAKEKGIDIEKPFPFLIQGKVKSFDWHTINWKDGDTEHSHEKHVNSGLHGTVGATDVEMLGFYSNKHHAIFTHHTTNMHIHVRTVNGEVAGHLDELTLGKGMVLQLPQ